LGDLSLSFFPQRELPVKFLRKGVQLVIIEVAVVVVVAAITVAPEMGKFRPWFDVVAP
jgi:hypothetical protein